MKKVFMYVNVDWFFLSHRLPIAEKAFENNIEMTVLTDYTKKHKYSDYSGFKLKKSQIKRKNKFLLHDFSQFIATFFFIKRERPDLIHAVTLKPILFLGIIARMMNIPFIGAISGLGPAFQAGSLITSIRKRIIVIFYKFIFNRKNSYAICQSTHDRNVLIENDIITKDRITLIHGSGVDLNKFKPLKNKLSKNPIVFMAARLLSDKGVIEFCKAAKMINENRIENIDFKLAGPIDNLSPTSLSLEEVKNLCDKGNVDYLGEIKSMNLMLAEADLFVYPSYYPEGIPKVLLEASACGTPVITTDHPGCRDAIIENETGISVPPRDVFSLTKEMENLLNNPNKILKMGINAHKHAQKFFCVEQVILKHYQLYKILIND